MKAQAESVGTAERRTVTVDEAAKILGIGRNAAYEAIKRGELPHLKIGRRIVIPRAAFDRLLNGDTEPAA